MEGDAAPGGIAVPEDRAKLVALEPERGEDVHEPRAAALVATRRVAHPADGPSRHGQIRELVHVVLEVLVGHQGHEMRRPVQSRHVARRESRGGVQAQPARGVEWDETSKGKVDRLEVRAQIQGSMEHPYERQAVILDQGRHGRDCRGRLPRRQPINPSFMGWTPPGRCLGFVLMEWPVVAVQWLHVLLGILWFGNALVLDVIVIPAINRLPIVSQREVASYIGSRATPIFHLVVPLIVILGIIRGTVPGTDQERRCPASGRPTAGPG